MVKLYYSTEQKFQCKVKATFDDQYFAMLLWAWNQVTRGPIIIARPRLLCQVTHLQRLNEPQAPPEKLISFQPSNWPKKLNSNQNQKKSLVLIKAVTGSYFSRPKRRFSSCISSSCISSRSLATSSMDSTEDLNRIAVVDDPVEIVEERKEYPWKRSKKMAAMLSFSGKNYYGMQRNPGPLINTIEDELLKALAKSGAIDPEWETNPQKAFFTRASRTDKGVSAARMVVSLKMILDPPSLDEINSHLPSDMRLQNVVRATKNFNCQSSADARTYLYLLPTFAFAPVEEVATEAWRGKPDTIEKVNEVLKCYVGSHFFHNYTSAKLPMEPSSRRFMHEVEAGAPFEKHGLEWSVLKVKGQSFMLHQIRKMIGLALAIVRGHTGPATLETAWGDERIDIPRAPGLGLMLDTIHYERYNKRYGEDGQHDRLDWAGQHEEVEKFKEDFIFSDIMKTEMEEKSMLLWLGQVCRFLCYLSGEREINKNVATSGNLLLRL